MTAEEISACRSVIKSTILEEDVAAIDIRSASPARPGRMLATADLLAQLSSSTYKKLMDLKYRLLP